MVEDSRCLRNQSRFLHRLHRRNRRFLRWTARLGFAAVTVFTGAAAIDVIADLGWGYAPKDIWGGLGMMALAVLFWLIARLILSVPLAIARHLYGSEPDDPLIEADS